MTEIALLDAEAAAAGDQRAVDAGDTWAGLMERAAGHLARGVVRCAGGAYGRRVAVVVGKGNNGGDGWAVARRLRDLGASCWVVAVPGTDVETSDEAAENRRRWIASGGRTSAGVGDLTTALTWADVVVDALLGTGISGDPRGDVGKACAAINDARDRSSTLRVVACDVPSGVSSDDGSAGEGAVRADLTVTFGGWKRGLLLHPGSDHAGEVVVGDLGRHYAPPAVDWRALTAAGARPLPLDTRSDKRSRGVVKVIAGSVGSAGAAILATRGALHAGAGLLTLASPAHIQRVIAPTIPPAMTEPLAHQGDALSAKGAAQVDLDGLDAVVAGPGLTPGEGTYALARRLLETDTTVVLDADALNVFRDDPSPLERHAGQLVLTPHERELARIGAGQDGRDAWKHRVERVPELARRYGATVVAKGPGTIIAAPDGRVWVNPTGSAALGTGGTGDVLAGMIGAAVARADDVPLAVARAVFWHGLAGQLAGNRRAGYATAEDVADTVPEALAETARLADEDPSYPFGPA